MRVSRQAIASVTILGLLIAVLVMLLRRSDGAAARQADEVRATPASVPTIGQTLTASTANAGDEVGDAEATDLSPIECRQVIHDAAEFAKREGVAAGGGAERSEEWWRAELAKLQRSGAESRDPELFLAAFLADPPEGRDSSNSAMQSKLLDLAGRATSSGSKALAWHALRACSAAKQFCPIADLEQRLLEVDKQNAESWALVATLRYERGDFAGALAAMQGAARAPTSAWYWTETIALVERSLASETAMPFSDRWESAIGIAVSALPFDQSLKICRVESASSRAWGDACLAFATLRGEHNETDAARLFAYAIREQVLKARGDTESAAKVAAEQARYRAEQFAGGGVAGSRAELQQALIAADPARFQGYLGAVREFGELAGTRRFLRQEVPSLLERAGLLGRDGVRECVAQLFVPPAGAGPRAAAERVQVGDKLQISERGQNGSGSSTTHWVGEDGKITMSRVPGVVALGKTTVQLQREIAAALAGQIRSPDVLVIVIRQRSREELRLEFDNARKDAAEVRKKAH